jgi:hypothetical protein
VGALAGVEGPTSKSDQSMVSTSGMGVTSSPDSRWNRASRSATLSIGCP